MCQLYEVIIYTASIKCYAEEIVSKLDPKGLIPYKLYREDCTIMNGNLIKNLARLGRDLKDVIIVDNSPSCYKLQPCNGIPIKTWFDDENDLELEALSPFLERLAKVNDIRDYLREIIIDNVIDYNEAIEMIERIDNGVPIILNDIHQNEFEDKQSESDIARKKKSETLSPKRTASSIIKRSSWSVTNTPNELQSNQLSNKLEPPMNSLSSERGNLINTENDASNDLFNLKPVKKVTSRKSTFAPKCLSHGPPEYAIKKSNSSRKLDHYE